MKWKIYRLCSLFNFMAGAGCLCLLMYFSFAEHGKGIFLELFLSLVTLLVIAKNLMALKLSRNLKAKEAHSERFGVAFIFLWVLNLLVLAMIGMGTYVLTTNLLKHDMEVVSNSRMITVAVFYFSFFTMAFTLCLDMKMEKKATLQEDLGDQFLQSGDHL